MNEFFTEGAKLTEALDPLVYSISEIAEYREIIEARGQELIEKHNIDPTFFESPTRTLLFAAVALNAQEVIDNPQGHNEEALRRDRQLVDNLTLLLAVDYVPPYEGAPIGVEAGSLSQLMCQDERLVDRQLTSEVQDLVVHGAVLDTTRQALGIVGEDDPFILRVVAEKVVDPGLRSELEATTGMAAAELDDYLAYYEGESATFEGMTYLIVGNRAARAAQQGNAIVLRHEYVHTQGSYRVTEVGMGGVGRAFEEQRAMVLSNDSDDAVGDYRDVIDMFSALDMIAGVNVNDHIKQFPADQDLFYGQLASDIGLQSMLDLAMVSSAHFTPHSPGVERDVFMHLGGVGSVLKRIEHRVLHTDEQRQALRERAWAYANEHNKIPPYMLDHLTGE